MPTGPDGDAGEDRDRAYFVWLHESTSQGSAERRVLGRSYFFWLQEKYVRDSAYTEETGGFFSRFVTTINAAVTAWWKPILTILIMALIIIEIVGTYTAARNRLVVFPFEMRGDKSADQSVGQHFATSLAAYLTDIRATFPREPASFHEMLDTAGGAPNIVEFVVSRMPASVQPEVLVPERGAIAIEPLKFGPFSLSIGSFLLQHWPKPQSASISGSIENWGHQLRARVFINGAAPFAVSVPADTSMEELLQRVGAAVVHRFGWLPDTGMNPRGMYHFIEGARHHARYLAGDGIADLNQARAYFLAAVNESPGSAVARLHLAGAQRSAALAGPLDEEGLLSAIQNFSALLGRDSLTASAEIGLVQSSIQLLERDVACGLLYGYLQSVLERVEAWNLEQSGPPEVQIVRAILRGRMQWLIADRAMSDGSCSHAVQHARGTREIGILLERTAAAYDHAERTIRQHRGQKPWLERVGLHYIEYQRVHLLGTMFHFHMGREDRTLARRSLDDAIRLATSLVGLHQASALPSRAFSLGNLRGTIAEDYLRRATLAVDEVGRQSDLVEADLHLVAAATDGGAETARWASLRLANLRFAQGRWRDGFDLILRSRGLAAEQERSLSQVLNSELAALGAMVEMHDQRARFLTIVSDIAKANHDGLFVRTVLADAQRRHGQLVEAQRTIAAARRLASTPTTGWVGPLVLERLSFVEAKLAAACGDMEGGRAILAGQEASASGDAAYQASRLFDLYEIAVLVRDEERARTLLTGLRYMAGSETFAWPPPRAPMTCGTSNL